MMELTAYNVCNTKDKDKPTPRINLSSQEMVRLEVGRVYREARAGDLPTDIASRLTYILIGINKMLEAEAAKSDNTISIVERDTTLDGIDLGSLDKEQLITLEIAINTIECIRLGKPTSQVTLSKYEHMK